MIATAEANPAFAPVFERLRGILEPYGRRMHVIADAEGAYGIDPAWGAAKREEHDMAHRKAMGTNGTRRGSRRGGDDRSAPTAGVRARRSSPDRRN